MRGGVVLALWLAVLLCTVLNPPKWLTVPTVCAFYAFVLISNERAGKD